MHGDAVAAAVGRRGQHAVRADEQHVGGEVHVGGDPLLALPGIGSAGHVDHGAVPGGGEEEPASVQPHGRAHGRLEGDRVAHLLACPLAGARQRESLSGTGQVTAEPSARDTWETRS